MLKKEKKGWRYQKAPKVKELKASNARKNRTADGLIREAVPYIAEGYANVEINTIDGKGALLKVSTGDRISELIRIAETIQ